MSGSFLNRRSLRGSTLAQAEWRHGFERGKKGDASLNETIEQQSISFRSGYACGWEKFLGLPAPTILPAPKNQSREEIAKEQFSRGCYMAQKGLFVSETVLLQCHPEFLKGYWQNIDEPDFYEE